MGKCRMRNAELGGGWRYLGGEAPIPKLAAHWSLEPGGVVCVSAAFGSPTRTFRPLRGLGFFGFAFCPECRNGAPVAYRVSLARRHGGRLFGIISPLVFFARRQCRRSGGRFPLDDQPLGMLRVLSDRANPPFQTLH